MSDVSQVDRKDAVTTRRGRDTWVARKDELSWAARGPPRMGATGVRGTRAFQVDGREKLWGLWSA